jgi:stage II sporulation protein AB (anti-sigma F factor)
MRMIIPSYSRNEAFARTAAAAFASQLDPTVEEINDIKAAVSEAVTNCIVHGYPDKIGDIEIVARIIEHNTFYIRIKDKGVGIPDIKQAMLPLFTTCEEGERAGLGFAVMESFMDKLRVTSRLGKGTSVIMTKRINSRNE